MHFGSVFNVILFVVLLIVHMNLKKAMYATPANLILSQGKYRILGRSDVMKTKPKCLTSLFSNLCFCYLSPFSTEPFNCSPLSLSNSCGRRLATVPLYLSVSANLCMLEFSQKSGKLCYFGIHKHNDNT